MKEQYSSLNFKFMEGVSKGKSQPQRSQRFCVKVHPYLASSHKTPSVNLKFDNFHFWPGQVLPGIQT